MSRPKKDLTDKEWDSVKYLCMIHCTGEEIAGVMQMDYDTLNRICKDKYGYPISEYIKNNQSNGKMSLRRAQWKLAEAGNPTMLIWLGRQWLGQCEKIDMSLGVSDKSGEVAALDEYFSKRNKEGTT